MSDSVRPHRRQPTRLPRPWDSPGKNTGVGCHFPLQGMKVESESEVAQSHLTPSDPMDCSPPGSCIHGTVQARVLEWGAIACSKRSLTMLNNYKLILVLLDCFFCFCIFSLLWLNLFFKVFPQTKSRLRTWGSKRILVSCSIHYACPIFTAELG